MSGLDSEIEVQDSGVGKSVAIVGGGGYIGYHIGAELYRKGHTVTLFDIAEPDSEWLDDSNEVPHWNEKSARFKFIRGSVLNFEELKNAFQSADGVIHCASYGMSGKEQMPWNWGKTEAINVGGTKNVIDACCAQGVTSLIYTSSFNVIFGGEEIINGDESLPYFPLYRHTDHYSRTKSVAEQLVIMADGKVVSAKNTQDGPHFLRTSALRLAGVMGLKEKRHLPRIINSLPYLKFTYGYKDGLVQFITLPNVVSAHVKCLDAIMKQPEKIGGQAYFISDGVPINNFEFFRPLMDKLGLQYPHMVLPMWLIWFTTYFIQFIFGIVVSINSNWAFTPFLTPAEINKTAVTHYFSNAKATKDFGYVPENPNDLTEVAEYFYQKQLKERKCKTGDRTNQWMFGSFLVIVFIVSFIFIL